MITGMNPLTTYECTIHVVTMLDGPASDPITVTTNPGKFLCIVKFMICTCMYIVKMEVCLHNIYLLSVDHFLTAQPGAVYLHVSSLPADTEVRIDWLPPPGSNTSTIITSYEVVYSLYEAVKDTRSVRLNSDATSYVIQDLSKHSKH